MGTFHLSLEFCNEDISHAGNTAVALSSESPSMLLYAIHLLAMDLDMNIFVMAVNLHDSIFTRATDWGNSDFDACEA